MGKDEHFRKDVDIDDHLWVQGSLNFGRTGTTQTSAGAAVIINSSAGIITTANATSAVFGASLASVQVLNDHIKAESTVLVTIVGSSLTAGAIAYAVVSAIGSGSFIATIYNIGATSNVATTPIKIGFLIV